MIKDNQYSLNPFKTSIARKRELVKKEKSDLSSSNPKVSRSARILKAGKDVDRFERQTNIRKKSSSSLNLKGGNYKGDYPKTAPLRLKVNAMKKLKISDPSTSKSISDSRKEARRNRAKSFISSK